jgi:hypothetical protein
MKGSTKNCWFICCQINREEITRKMAIVIQTIGKANGGGAHFGLTILS